MVLRKPPLNKAIQNLLSKVGISINSRTGLKNRKEKNINDQATTYLLMSFSAFLLKTSLIDSKKAV